MTHISRLRPSASASGSPFCSGRMLMGPHRRAIHVVDLPVQLPRAVRLPLELSQHPIPDPGLPPTVESVPTVRWSSRLCSCLAV